MAKNSGGWWCWLILASLFGALVQVGCGGGGGGSDEPAAAPVVEQPVATVSESGKVVQGPVAGAMVFADLNGNFSLDSDEPSALSDDSGRYDFSVKDLPRLLISRGGYDTLRKKPAFAVAAPGGAANLTPVTTLVALSDSSKELSTILDTLLPNDGYDVDLSRSTGASKELFKIAKGAELLVELFDGLGAVQETQHRILFRHLGNRLADLDPLFLNLDAGLAEAMGEAAAAACQQVGTSAPAGDFSCGDPAGLKSAVVLLAEQLLAIIDALPAPVTEEAIEAALAALSLDIAPLLKHVQTVFLDLEQIEVDGQPFSSGGSIPANFGVIDVHFRGHNDHGVEKTFSGGSVTLTIDAENSQQQAVIEAKGVQVSVGLDGTPNIQLDASGKVTLLGRTAEGITISGGGVEAPGVLVLQGGQMRLDRVQMEEALKATFGILPTNLLKPGNYVIMMRAKGLPLADRAFAVRVI